MSKRIFKKLTPRSIRAWQWGNAFGNLFFFAVPAVYASVFGYENFHYWVLLGTTFVILLFWTFSVAWLPYLQWKYWRYSVDEEEIDLVHGVLVRTHTLIPINRVQHVDTRQGPLLRWYNLSSVTISTAATTHEIPALDADIADRVRSQISTHARLAEDDV